MSDKTIHIFESTSCISADNLLKYQEGKLSEQENHSIEKHLSDCGFCADALEGFALVGNAAEVKNIVLGLNAEITSSLQPPKSVFNKIVSSPIFSIAASVVLVIGFYFGMQEIYFSNSADQNLAMKTEIASETASKKEELNEKEKTKKEEVIKALELAKKTNLAKEIATIKSESDDEKVIVIPPTLIARKEAKKETKIPIIANSNGITASDDVNAAGAFVEEMEEMEEVDDAFGDDDENSDLLAEKITTLDDAITATNALSDAENRVLEDTADPISAIEIENGDESISYNQYAGKSRKVAAQNKKTVKEDFSTKETQKKLQSNYETALASYREKNYNLAIESLEESLTKKPPSKRNTALLGLCFLKVGDITRSKQQLEFLLNENSKTKKKESSAIDIQEALTFINKGKINKASRILEKWLLN